MINQKVDVESKKQISNVRNQKHYSSLGRKLLIEGIAFVTISSLPFVTGCATSNYNSYSSWNNSRQGKNDDIVCAEKRVLYNGRYYTYRIESRGDYIYHYWDGVLSDKSNISRYVDIKKFGGEFKIKRFIVFDSSIVWVGIDGTDNYGLMIQNGVMGNVNYYGIGHGLPVGELKRRGIDLEIDYSNKERVYLIKLKKKNKTVVLTKINDHGKVTYNKVLNFDQLFPEE